MADPPKLVQHPPQLRLEHDDDGDDDVESGVLEQPREKHQVELRGDDADDRQQDEADDDLGALRATQQPQQQIKDHGDNCDVEHLDDPKVADHIAELLEELAQSEAPNRVANTAIWA